MGERLVARGAGVGEVPWMGPQPRPTPWMVSAFARESGIGYVASLWVHLWWHTGGRCAYCLRRVVRRPWTFEMAAGRAGEIEHMVPRCRGGSNAIENLTMSCRSCNRSKGRKTAAEFLADRSLSA